MKGYFERISQNASAENEETVDSISGEEILRKEDKTDSVSEESCSEDAYTLSGNMATPIGNNGFFSGIGIGLFGAIIIATIGAILINRSKKSKTVKGQGMPVVIKMISGQCLTEPEKIELRDGLLLGSSKKCDICFVGEGVEPEHAKIVIQDGQAYIVDLDSQEGVTIGGMRIQDRNPLKSGYVVGLGEVEFILKY